MLKPQDCNGCALKNLSNGFSLPEGLCTNGVLAMGEGLGHNEAIDGLPFRPQGAAGSLLEQAFRITRTSRTQYLIDNIIRCQPPGDNLTGYGYEHAAIQHCTEKYSHRVYNDPRVKVILALGAVAFRTITGLAGKKLGISECRGYVFRNDGFNVPIVGSYHPAHIRRGKLAYTDYLVHDLRKAIAVANGSYKSWCTAEKYPHKYQLYPTIDEAKSYFYQVKDNPQLDLAYDIETPHSAEAEEDERDEITGNEILSIQFSLGRGKGIYMPWQGNFIKIAQAILRRENRKLCFNGWHFDNPKLYANNCQIFGKIVDLMWKFHYLKPDLEMGLQKVASICDFPFIWKHFASDERMQRFYGCVDVDVLHWIEMKIDKVLESMKVPMVA
jgi:uracil-DNA glycosylase family 4